ncbi:hypothetical protein IQ07DRAFT_629453, partial [Pyrenochaeta sp. DS3sAY3a]
MSSSNGLPASTVDSIQGSGACPPPQAGDPEPKAKGPSVITMIVSEQPKPTLCTLPNELIHEIFAYALMLPSLAPLNSLRMMTHMSPNRGRFAKFLVLSKHWAPFVQALFYRQNSFDCRKHGWMRVDLLELPGYNILPPQPVRHLLRRLLISLKPVSATEIKASTYDLRTAIWRTPGWKALRRLTGAEAGFPNLEELTLELTLYRQSAIMPNQKRDKAVMRHAKQGGITIKARKITMRADRSKWES